MADLISPLKEGIRKIDDGTIQINNGASELKTGGLELKQGTSDFSSGVNALNSGIIKTQTGIDSAYDGLTTLNDQSSILVNGSSEIKVALQNINVALSGVSVAANNIEDLVSASGSIKNGIDKLHTDIGYMQYKALMSQNGLDIDALKSSNTTVISELSTQISNLQTTLAHQGKARETVSFVSEKNRNVASVQFVIRTEKIEKINREEIEAVAIEALNFWQKLLRLFGLH